MGCYPYEKNNKYFARNFVAHSNLVVQLRLMLLSFNPCTSEKVKLVYAHSYDISAKLLHKNKPNEK